MILELVRRLSLLSRGRKRIILVAYDLTAMGLALWAAFSTRLGILYFPDNFVVLASAVATAIIGIVALYRLQVYRIVLRYFDLRTVSRIFLAAAITAVAWVILIYFTQGSIEVAGREIMVPRSVGFIYCGFLFLLLFMGRYVMALLLAGAGRESPRKLGIRRNIAIYGANSAGISLADSMRANSQYRLKAFIEDDPALHGQIVAGVPIYSPRALADLARAAKLSEVFLAMPNATRSQRLAAVSRLT